MKIPAYLSYSAMTQFYKDRREYYLKYLAEKRPPRMPQTVPMSVGSAFDAYVKEYLHNRLSGDKPIVLREIFESQVEEQNREQCWPIGQYLFECYRDSGALADIMGEMSGIDAAPVFEGDLLGEVCGIPLRGKPDLQFHAETLRIIYDWKVNGFMGKSAQSPKAGYVKCRDGWSSDVAPPSRSHNTRHKDAYIKMHGSILYNSAANLEDINPEWAGQLSIYSWLDGTAVGDPILAGIDQIVSCGAEPGLKYPRVRIASFRGFIGAEFQMNMLHQLTSMWNIINSGHIFTDMSHAESDALCEQLENQHLAYDGTHKLDGFIQDITRNYDNY